MGVGPKSTLISEQEEKPRQRNEKTSLLFAKKRLQRVTGTKPLQDT
jgi:hypothetical protein